MLVSQSFRPAFPYLPLPTIFSFYFQDDPALHTFHFRKVIVHSAHVGGFHRVNLAALYPDELRSPLLCEPIWPNFTVDIPTKSCGFILCPCFDER